MRKILILLFSPALLMGAYFDIPFDARSLALGRATCGLLTGTQALFVNPGGVAAGRKFEALAVYEIPYSLGDLKKYLFGFTYSSGRYGLGLGITRKALLDSYSESNVALSLSGKLGPFGVGINIREFLLDFTLEGESHSKRATTLDVGSQLDMGWFKMGIAYLNLLDPEVGVFEGDIKASRSFRLGAVFVRPYNVYWLFGYSKVRNEREIFRFGIEAWFTRGFAARFGVDRKYITLGFGLKENWWALDFGAEAHRYLGTTYSMGFMVFQP